MILGITGTDGAGKGSVVDYLVSRHQFVHYSARALFVEALKKRNEELSRANMRLIANELRAQYGNDFLITHYVEKIQKDGTQKAVIESIRALAEAETLKAHGGVLIAVDADLEIRYERVQKRRSESDKVSFEQFLAHEELEINDPDPHGMQKRAVMDLADYTIFNNGTPAQLEEEVEKIFIQLV